MPKKLLIIRHSGLRRVTRSDVLASLQSQRGDASEVEVDTRCFSDAVERGQWGTSAVAIADSARRILADAAEVELHYCGLAEIPHVVALGSCLGDEHAMVIHEWDRDSRSWQWPSSRRTLSLRTSGISRGDPIRARGSAVLVLEISSVISDDDIDAACGTDHLAVVHIQRKGKCNPEICCVRSAADLELVRRGIRRALSALRARLPNVAMLYVFAAAPVSVCFALGQELKPRNSAPAQTYRYRRVAAQPCYTPAILLPITDTSQWARNWPDPIANIKLARALGIAEANRMAKQLRAALHEAGQSAPPAARGRGVRWSHRQLRAAVPHLRAGKLHAGLVESGLIEPA